ncbi:MAG: hypothetical protein U1F23_01830 [Lysobacterales bacterium]
MDGAFSIDAAKDATAGAKTLALSSDLVGTTIDLPSPLGKDAASPESIRIELPVPWAGQTLHAALGDAATAAVRLPEGVKPVAATITFGAAAGTLPARGIRIDGSTGTVDIGAGSTSPPTLPAATAATCSTASTWRPRI